MATAGSWSTNWSTGKITSDGKWWNSDYNEWEASTETIPSSAFSYTIKEKVPTFWLDGDNKLQPIENTAAKPVVKKNHLSELEELFEI